MSGLAIGVWRASAGHPCHPHQCSVNTHHVRLSIHFDVTLDQAGKLGRGVYGIGPEKAHWDAAKRCKEASTEIESW
eukprot:2763251-Rhodomonas_salina.2